MDVVLIRGMGRESRHWGDFGERLRAQLPEARPLALDPPGVGTEHHQRAPTSLRRIVADMRRRWRPTAPPGSRVVFGISFGGMIAMQWAVEHPDDFDHVVLANTSAANVGRPLERLRPAALRKLVSSMREPDALRRERSVLELISNDPAARERVAPEWAALAEDRRMGRSTVVRQIAAASRFRAPASLTQRVLVLSCPNDHFVSASCSERLAQHLGATIERHPSAGHALTVDAPDWTVERIAAWLREDAA